MTDNILQEILIIFQSDDLNQIEWWHKLLAKIIAECIIEFSNIIKKRVIFVLLLDKTTYTGRF